MDGQWPSILLYLHKQICVSIKAITTAVFLSISSDFPVQLMAFNVSVCNENVPYKELLALNTNRLSVNGRQQDKEVSVITCDAMKDLIKIAGPFD